MADKKGAKPAGKQTVFTNSRLSVDDAEVLADLAAKRGTTVAALYHELFAGAAKKMLIEETERRLKELKSG